jgi:hypothetical protein
MPTTTGIAILVARTFHVFVLWWSSNDDTLLVRLGATYFSSPTNGNFFV